VTDKSDQILELGPKGFLFDGPTALGRIVLAAYALELPEPSTWPFRAAPGTGLLGRFQALIS